MLCVTSRGLLSKSVAHVDVWRLGLGHRGGGKGGGKQVMGWGQQDGKWSEGELARGDGRLESGQVKEDLGHGGVCVISGALLGRCWALNADNHSADTPVCVPNGSQR